jgi:lysozyme
MSEFWLYNLTEQLKRHEGFVPHAYQDHLGFWTIGYGRLIDKSRNGGITQDEADMLLRADVARVITELHARLSFYERLPDRKKQALANMAFQLGINGLLNFRRMLSAIKDGDWTRARIEALDSRWASQTPARAREIANMIGEQE